MKNLAKVVPVAVIVGIALWSVWPVVVKLNRIADYGSDGWFINWAVNRAGKNIWESFGNTKMHSGSVFDGYIYYPNKNSLAYSDMFFVSGFWTHWLMILSKSPGVASGLVMGAGQVFTMLIIYFWWSNLTKNKWGAVVGAVAFGLSQIRWEYRAHMQMWSMQYWLVAVWLVGSWFGDKKKWKLYLGAIVLGLQIWESPLLVYFAIAVLIIIYFVTKPKVNLKYLFFAALLAGIIMLPVARVYSGVAKEFGFVRSIRDAAHGGMSVDDLWGKFYSPGLYLLLIAAMLKLITHPNPSLNLRKGNLRWFLIVAVLGLVMAMGPVLKWQGKTVKALGKYAIPLPYAALYYVVPGMNAFREPSRWILVSAWAASGIIAMGIFSVPPPNPPPKLGGGNKGGGMLGVLGVLTVAVVGGTHFIKYVDLPNYEQIPQVYKWLKDQPGKVIVELPRGGDEVESKRMYYNLFHEKYLVNGFSGFAPSVLPESKYKSIGVDYKIVWKDEKAVVYFL